MERTRINNTTERYGEKRLANERRCSGAPVTEMRPDDSRARQVQGGSWTLENGRVSLLQLQCMHLSSGMHVAGTKARHTKRSED